MRKAILLAALVPLLAGLPGCGSDIHDGVNMKKKVGFGAIVANSGPNRSLGSEYFRGMKVAEHSLNAAGGVESKEVHVLIYDSSGEPERGLDAARTLTRDFDVPFIAVAHPDVYDRVAPELADDRAISFRLDPGPDVENKPERALHAFVTVAEETRVMTEAARDEGWKSVLILAPYNRYGNEAAARLEANLPGAGVTKIRRVVIGRDAKGQISVENAVKEHAYDAICVFGVGAEIPPALFAALKGGHAGAIVGNHAFGGKIVTSLDPGVLRRLRFTATQFHTEPDRAMSMRFREDYKHLNLAPADLFGALGYDQVMLVFGAAKSEESLSPKAVRSRILEEKTFEGAAGTYRFDAEGNASLPLTLVPMVDLRTGTR